MMMPNADAIALGKHIKAVRKAMKMTQEQLALKSNVSVKYISNIENGKQNPSFDILSSILHVLPLSLDSVINPNLSEAERECRELESIYFACPPEMRKLAIHLTELSEQNKNT
jgi:transcriptional regulator with XRE-family HTH domain